MHTFPTQCDERTYHCWTHITLHLILIKSLDLKSRHLFLQTTEINSDDESVHIIKLTGEFNKQDQETI